MAQLSGVVGVLGAISHSASSWPGQAQTDPQTRQLADDADSVMTSSLRKTPSIIDVCMFDALDCSGSPRKAARKRRAAESVTVDKSTGPDHHEDCVDDSGGGAAEPEPEPDDGLAPTARSRPASPSPSSSPPRQRPRLKTPPPCPHIDDPADVDGIGVAPDAGCCGGGGRLQDPVLPAPAAAAPPLPSEPSAPQAAVTPIVLATTSPDISAINDKNLTESRINLTLQQAKAHEKLAAERMLAAIEVANATAANLRAVASGAGASSNPGKGGGAPPRRGCGGTTAAPPTRLPPAVTLMLADATQRKATAAAAAACADSAKGCSAHTTIQVDHHAAACQVFNLMSKYALRAAAARMPPPQHACAAAGGVGSDQATDIGGRSDQAGGNAKMCQQQLQLQQPERWAVAPVETSEPSQLPPAAAAVVAVPGAGDVVKAAAPSPAVADLHSPGPPAKNQATTATVFTPPAPRPLQPGMVLSTPASSSPLETVPGTTRCPAAPASCPPAPMTSPTGAHAGGNSLHGGALPQQWLPEGGIAGFFSTQTQLPTITTAVVTAATSPAAAAPAAAPAAAVAFIGNANSSCVNFPAGSVSAVPGCIPDEALLTITTGGAAAPATATAPPLPCPDMAPVAGTIPFSGGLTSYTPAGCCASNVVGNTGITTSGAAAVTTVATAADTDFGGRGVDGGGGGDVIMRDCPQPSPAPPPPPPLQQQLSDPERMRLIHDAFSLDASPSSSSAAKPCTKPYPSTHPSTHPNTPTDGHLGMPDTIMSEADARAHGAWADCDDASLGGGVLMAAAANADNMGSVNGGADGAGRVGGGALGGGGGVGQEEEPGQLMQVPAHLLPPSDSQMMMAAQPQLQPVPAAAVPAGVDPAVVAAAAAVGETDCYATVTLRQPPPPQQQQQQQQPERQPRAQQQHHHHAEPQRKKAVTLAQQERRNEEDNQLTRAQPQPHRRPLKACAPLPVGACAPGAAAAAATMLYDNNDHTFDLHDQNGMDAGHVAGKDDTCGANEHDANLQSKELDAWLKSILNEDEAGCS